MPRIKDVAHVVAALTDTIPIDRPTESAAYHTTVQDIINLTPAAGKTIASVDKATVGLVDTYTITYTDLSTYEIVLTNGTDGVDGQGVAVGGTTGQVLAKTSNVNYETTWIDVPGGAVDSVNGQTGVVVLNAANVGAVAVLPEIALTVADSPVILQPNVMYLVDTTGGTTISIAGFASTTYGAKYYFKAVNIEGILVSTPTFYYFDLPSGTLEVKESVAGDQIWLSDIGVEICLEYRNTELGFGPTIISHTGLAVEVTPYAHGHAGAGIGADSYTFTQAEHSALTGYFGSPHYPLQDGVLELWKLNILNTTQSQLSLPATPSDGDIVRVLVASGNSHVINSVHGFYADDTSLGTSIQLSGVSGDYVEFTYSAVRTIWFVHSQNFLSYMSGLLAWSKVDKTGAVASDIGAASATHATTHQTGGSDPINMHAFHGVLSRATVSPLPTSITTTTFTLACATTPMTYYMDGVQVVVSADVSTILAGTAGFYFIYWDDAVGTLANSTTFPGIYPASTNVLVASVWWNGVDLGLVNDERHGYDRDQAWHTWAHRSVGTRWSSGLDLLTLTGTGAAATMTLGAGEILDEDITFTIPASASFATPNAYRLIYQTGATSYAFVSTLSAVPFYRGVNNRPNVVNSTGYVLTELGSSPTRYINFFVYATTDLLCPIYIVTETASNATISAGGYTSVANAKAVPWPNLSGVAISAEMKPLYRVVVRADGVVQTATAGDDYRSVSSLPQSAGTSSTTASAVSFAPAGNVASATVQQAIEELDLEKQAILVSGTNIKTINSTSILGSGDIVIAGGATIVFPFYTSAGVLDTIALVSNTHLPFTDAAGATKNILLTT